MQILTRLALLLLPCLLMAAGAGAADEVAVAVSEAGEAFIVEANIHAPVSLRLAWDVLVDFDHMSSILNNLTYSRVLRRDGNTLRVRQTGVAHYGALSFEFESEREVRLDPMRRIVSRNLSGSAKSMESEARLEAEGKNATLIRYRAQMVPDSLLVRTFGASAVQHEVEEQFRLMLDEMRRRAAPQPAR